MRYRIRRCVKCGRYTLRDRCPACGSETISPHPARFSPEDRYVEYRVMALYHQQQQQEGSLVGESNKSTRSGSDHV